MHKLLNLAAGLLLLGAGSVCQAKLETTELSQLPVLSPQTVHKTACSRTSNYFLRANYKAVNPDAAFAENIIDRYLSFLDFNRTLYTAPEVKDIYAHKDKILRAAVSCDLSYPFELYNQALRLRFAKYSYFTEALKQPLDLNAKEYVDLDRRKMPFAADKQTLSALWSAELKNEYITQVLNGKSDAKARDRLKRRYLTAMQQLAQTEPEDAFSAFENAFATAIDPHTSYLSPDDSENFRDDINLSLEGIGAVLMSEDEYTVINSLLPGSPAERSRRLKPKDKIVGVRQEDGSYSDIIGWRLTEVVDKIKGPKDTAVTLEIERGDGANAKTFTVKLVRDKIRLQDREAKGEVHLAQDGSKVGVLTIKSFYTDLHADIERELNRLRRDKISSLVIDLRSNGGGLLPEATSSTGLFIKNGPVVQVRDTIGNIMPQNDEDAGISYAGPLVVLINRMSASSSEIMAAALRDYGRALIVGDTSFGKGTVQQTRPLERVYDFNGYELGSIHYTIAKFYRINGDSTQLKGVSPDIVFPPLVDDNEIGERSEPNALPFDQIAAAKYQGFLNIDAYVPDLRIKHEERIRDNVFFKIMRSDMQRYLEFKAEKKLSVNLAERRQLQVKDDAYKLSTVNARLKAMGKPAVKQVKDLPDDFEFKDAQLDEAVNIAADFAKMQQAHQYSAATTPILTRFVPEP